MARKTIGTYKGTGRYRSTGGVEPAFTYIVVVNPGKSSEVRRIIYDTPSGFAAWKREQEARGNVVRVARKR